MITIYTGENGQGETLILEKLMTEYRTMGYEVITNIGDVKYNGFNPDRLSVVMSYEVFENIFDYCELLEVDNKLVFRTEDVEYTDESQYSISKFSDLISLITRNGQVLILDMPDTGLLYTETISLSCLLDMLRDTYKEVIIATRNSFLFWLADKAYIVTNYQSTEINPKKLSSYI